MKGHHISIESGADAVDGGEIGIVFGKQTLVTQVESGH